MSKVGVEGVLTNFNNEISSLCSIIAAMYIYLFVIFLCPLHLHLPTLQAITTDESSNELQWCLITSGWWLPLNLYMLSNTLKCIVTPMGIWCMYKRSHSNQTYSVSSHYMGLTLICWTETVLQRYNLLFWLSNWMFHRECTVCNSSSIQVI